MGHSVKSNGICRHSQLVIPQVSTFSYDGTVQWRNEGGSTPPPPLQKFRNFDEAEPNSQFREKYICNNLIRIRVSPICNLSGTSEGAATLRYPFYLSSTEFVEPPTGKKKFWVRQWYGGYAKLRQG
jgi:hypothetical protein